MTPPTPELEQVARGLIDKQFDALEKLGWAADDGIPEHIRKQAAEHILAALTTAVAGRDDEIEGLRRLHGEKAEQYVAERKQARYFAELAGERYATVERLTKALTDIRGRCQVSGYWREVIDEIARAALAADKQEKQDAP